MTELSLDEGDDVSLFAVGTILLRNRWRILRWVLLGAIVAAVSTLVKPHEYVATASFIPEGNDGGGSSLASIAGQFGISVSGGNPSQSGDFYLALLTSRMLLQQVARDTVVAPELGGRPTPIATVLDVQAATPKAQDEAAVNYLRTIVNPQNNEKTGAVEISVATKWPSVSLAIVTDLLQGVEDYNQRTRQGQAAAERKFVEGRLAIAARELREAEDRLEQFLQSNRQFMGSPELSFDHERIQRDLAVKQQVFSSLTQAYGEARIREVHNMPVITVFEPPFVPTRPQSRGGVRRVALGMVVGGMIAIVLAFLSDMATRRRTVGDAEAREFAGTVAEAKMELRGAVRRVTGRSRGAT